MQLSLLDAVGLTLVSGAYFFFSYSLEIPYKDRKAPSVEQKRTARRTAAFKTFSVFATMALVIIVFKVLGLI